MIKEMIAVDGWEPFMEPVVDPLLEEIDEAIARGASLAEFRDSLPSLLERMDDRRIAEALRRLGFSARLSGGAGLDGS